MSGTYDIVLTNSVEGRKITLEYHEHSPGFLKVDLPTRSRNCYQLVVYFKYHRVILRGLLVNGKARQGKIGRICLNGQPMVGETVLHDADVIDLERAGAENVRYRVTSDLSSDRGPVSAPAKCHLPIVGNGRKMVHGTLFQSNVQRLPDVAEYHGTGRVPHDSNVGVHCSLVIQRSRS